MTLRKAGFILFMLLRFRVDCQGEATRITEPIEGEVVFLGQEIRITVEERFPLELKSVIFRAGSATAAPLESSYEGFYNYFYSGFYRLTQYGAQKVFADLEFLSGRKETNSVTVTVLPFGPPVITASPIDLDLPLGGTGAFSIKAISREPQSIQWLFNGVAIPGETNSTLEIADAKISDQGFYAARVDSPGGTTTAGAPLRVTGHPIAGGGLILFANKTDGVDAPIRSGMDGRLLGPESRARLVIRKSLADLPREFPASPINNGYVEPRVFTLSSVAPGEKIFAQIEAWESQSSFPGSFYQWKSKIIEVTAGGETAAPLVGLEGFSTLIWDGYFWMEPIGGNEFLVRTGTNVNIHSMSAPEMHFDAPPITNVVYSWSKNGRPIAVANSRTLTLTNASEGDAGVYSVIGCDGWNVRSNMFRISVDTASPILRFRLDNLEVLAFPGSGFRIEKSTNFLNWSPALAGQILPNAIGARNRYRPLFHKEFYRAVTDR